MVGLITFSRSSMANSVVWKLALVSQVGLFLGKLAFVYVINDGQYCRVNYQRLGEEAIISWLVRCILDRWFRFDCWPSICAVFVSETFLSYLCTFNNFFCRPSLSGTGLYYRIAILQHRGCLFLRKYARR